MLNDKLKTSSYASLGITLIIVLMLLLPGLAGAVIVEITGLSSDPYSKGSDVEFQIEITLQDVDNYVPISNFSLDVTGPDSSTWIFSTDGTVIPLDLENITIEGVKVINSTHYGSGLGVGYETGILHTFGYGDGYGSNYGSGGDNITFVYNVTLNTTNYAVGDFKVKASLNTGNETKPSFVSSESTFTIVDTSPPTVTITYPSDSAIVLRKSSVNITASAADNVGVEKVEFYVDNELICIDTIENYTCNWDVHARPRIMHVLEVKAYDAEGNVGNSTIEVNSSNPLI